MRSTTWHTHMQRGPQNASRPHAPCCASGLVSQLMHGNAVHPHAVQARVRRVTVVGEHLHNRVSLQTDATPSAHSVCKHPYLRTTQELLILTLVLKIKTVCLICKHFASMMHILPLQHVYPPQYSLYLGDAATHPHRAARPIHQAALVLRVCLACYRGRHCAAMLQQGWLRPSMRRLSKAGANAQTCAPGARQVAQSVITTGGALSSQP